MLDSLYVVVGNSPEYTFLSGVMDVLLILSAAIGASVAVVGLRTWRQQLKGKTEYELARRLLKATYRVREAFRVVRNPAVMGGEVASALRKSGKTDEEIESRREWGTEGQRAVYNERLGVLWEAFTDLDVEILEAEVLWGPEVRDRLKALRECRGKLVSSLWMYFHLQEKRQLDEGDRKRWMEAEEVIWEVLSEGKADTFTQKIQDAVGEVESVVRPHLQL